MASARELDAWWRGLSAAEKQLVQHAYLMAKLTYLLQHPAALAEIIARAKDG